MFAVTLPELKISLEVAEIHLGDRRKLFRSRISGYRFVAARFAPEFSLTTRLCLVFRRLRLDQVIGARSARRELMDFFVRLGYLEKG